MQASCPAALYDNTTGSNNMAEGFLAGYNVTTGNYNIEIGIEGTQNKTFIAGIYNVPLTENAIVVTSTGQLGVAAVSSERFKTATASIGSNTAKLEQLRPVTFKLKSDAKGTIQYGLIAEEVAKIYPELVIRDEKGRIDGVRYDELAPMLLNEVQKQASEIRDLKKLVVDIQAGLVKLQAKDELVAQR